MVPNILSSQLHHKRIRLDRKLYGQLGMICSVTIGTRGRREVFADPGIARAARDALYAHAQKTGVPVYAYCLMTNHVHLVLGPSRDCDIIMFVGQYKNLAQRAAWRGGVTGRIWQVSFWDHFLREEEGLYEVARYVLNNPVRKGLVKEWRDYPYSGSLVLTLD